MAAIAKIITSSIAKTESIGNVVPVGTSKLERHAVEIDPLAIRIVRLVSQSKRPVVNVFYMTNVVTLIDKEPPPDRIARHVSN